MGTGRKKNQHTGNISIHPSGYLTEVFVVETMVNIYPISLARIDPARRQWLGANVMTLLLMFHSDCYRLVGKRCD